MIIHIDESKSDLKDGIKEVVSTSIATSYGENFKANMDNFLVERNLNLKYVGYFYGNGINMSVVTNNGFIQFNDDFPNIAHKECKDNFKGSFIKCYHKYQEFVDDFISGHDLNYQYIDKLFEKAFKNFIRDIFDSLSECSDIAIDCFDVK